MKNIPVYDKMASYARENNELEAYRTSKKANMACKTAISDAILKNYNNNTLDTKTALKELIEGFSLERIAVIAAVSLREKDWDGRISQWHTTSINCTTKCVEKGRARNFTANFRLKKIQLDISDSKEAKPQLCCTHFSLSSDLFCILGHKKQGCDTPIFKIVLSQPRTFFAVCQAFLIFSFFQKKGRAFSKTRLLINLMILLF